MERSRNRGCPGEGAAQGKGLPCSCLQGHGGNEGKGKAEGTLINTAMIRVYVFILADLGEAFSGLMDYLNGTEPRLFELAEPPVLENGILVIDPRCPLAPLYPLLSSLLGVV